MPPGPESAIFFMHLLNQAFSDQRWDIEKVAREGDTVAIYCRHSGRHTGDFFGLPATGRTFDYRQMHLIRMRGDRGAEHWAVRDDAALHRQLTGEPGSATGRRRSVARTMPRGGAVSRFGEQGAHEVRRGGTRTDDAYPRLLAVLRGGGAGRRARV